MTVNIRHFEALLGRAGLPNTGENRRLLETCIREVMEMGRIPREELLEAAHKEFTDPEAKKEFEEKVIKLLFQKC